MEPDHNIKKEAVDAVKWWLSVHMIPGSFVDVDVDLPITQQIDSFSCGVFAVNSVQCILFPSDNLLEPHESITERYRWFLAVINRHNEVVSRHILFYFANY